MKAVGLVAFLSFCAACDEPVKGPSDSGAILDEAWTNQAFTCSCDCTATALGAEPELLDVNNVCLPEGWDAADYCEQRVCPLIEIYANDTLAGALAECDAQCVPAAVNGRGTEAPGGVSRMHDDEACLEACDEIECEGSITFDGFEGNNDECTFATTSCPEDASSFKVCRGGEVSADGDGEEASTDGDSGVAAECVDTGSSAEVCDDGGDEVATAVRERPAVAPLFEVPSPLSEVHRLGAGSCLNGWGEFVLVPTRTYDRNSDGVLVSVLQPLQIAGVGRMAESAWITHAAIADRADGPLLAFGPDARVGIDDGDHLVVSRGGRVEVSIKNLELAPGQLPAGTPFVLEGTRAVGGWRTVALEWTCIAPPAPTSERLNGFEPPGTEDRYHFQLDDLGCALDWPQQFSVSLIGSAKLSVALSGNPRARRSVPLRQDADGAAPREFSLRSNGFRVAGEVVGYDEYAMDVRLNEVSYRRVPLCTPGTYRLQVEK